MSVIEFLDQISSSFDAPAPRRDFKFSPKFNVAEPLDCYLELRDQGLLEDVAVMVVGNHRRPNRGMLEAIRLIHNHKTPTSLQLILVGPAFFKLRDDRIERLGYSSDERPLVQHYVSPLEVPEMPPHKTLILHRSPLAQHSAWTSEKLASAIEAHIPAFEKDLDLSGTWIPRHPTLVTFGERLTLAKPGDNVMQDVTRF